MFNKIKKLVATLLVTIIFLTVIPFMANAEVSSNEVNTEVNSNEVNIAKYAISFINTICGEANVEAGEVIAILNEDDALSGYCVNIMDNGKPNGYVVVKFSENEPVVSEYCIEPGVENPYMEIMKRSDITKREDTVFYSIGPNEYHIYVPKEEVFVGFSEVIPAMKFEEYKMQVKYYKDEISKQSTSLSSSSSELGQLDRNITYSSLDAYTVVSDTYEGSIKSGDIITGATGITYYGTSAVSSANKTYGCSVVALSNMMKYYRSREKTNIDSDFSTLYSALWVLADTNSKGSTPIRSIAPAAVSYMKIKNYSISSDGYLLNLYSDFTRDIRNDKPIIFSYGADYEGEPVGHTVFCVGYVDTTSYQYLRIADGWNTYLRYINFNGYNYNRKNGWSFTAP